MLAILAAVAVGSLAAPASGWYGPAVVAFPAEAPAQPHDPARYDARVTFEGPARTERLAFYRDGAWRAVLTTRTPGAYTARLAVNGRTIGQPVPVQVRPADALSRGYVRIDGATRRFHFDDGTGYFPLGINLGWANNDVPDLPKFLGEMGAAGMDWARIWACHWDGKNPMWTRGADGRPTPGAVDEAALAKWDAIVEAAERAGVRFQLVLFHHGPYSSNVNSNWGEHPWNRANGGFLERPDDFFTDPTARRLARQWLRIAVARWGHSPAVMAWELFNEVEWCDASRNAPATVAAWHREMADYLREIDPVGRLVTTSSEMEQPGLYDAVDFYQPHAYPSDVGAAVAAKRVPADKPLFFGEVGLGGGPRDVAVERNTIRDAIWGGVTAGHPGAAQYWYWDWVARHGELPQYALAARILREAGWAERRTVRRLDVAYDAGTGADLRLPPGGGWGPASRLEFALPADADAFGTLPRFLQSQNANHRAMFPGPVRLAFRAERAGSVRLRLAEVSAAGGEVVVRVNGREAARRAWPGTGANRPSTDVVEAAFPAGEVAVEIENVGADWVVVQDLEVGGIGPRAVARGAGDGRAALVRIRRAAGAGDAALAAPLTGLGLPDGRARVRVWDLGKPDAAPTSVDVQVRGGATDRPVPLAAADAVALVETRAR